MNLEDFIYDIIMLNRIKLCKYVVYLAMNNNKNKREINNIGNLINTIIKKNI